MAPDDPITPDPDAEEQAEAWVEKEIADERAREAPIDDAIWTAEGEAIARAEGAADQGQSGSATSGGWMDRIRSLFGRR